MHLAALEAFVNAVELEASGNVAAAYDAIQTILATKETLMKLRHPWTAREQRDLDAILRDAPPDEARDRVHQCLCWHKFTIGAIAARSDWVRKGAEERRKGERSAADDDDPVRFNYDVDVALAEIALPPPGKHSRTDVALSHLKINHPEIYKAIRPRIKSSWWRTRMDESRKIRAEIPGIRLERVTSAEVKARRRQSLYDQLEAAAVSNLPALEPQKEA